METLKDLVAACRDASGAVIETPARTAPYTYDDFVPNVWKSGNLLGHYGVHPGANVTVVAGPKDATAEETTRRIDAADALFGALGATMVGATVSLEPTEPVDSRVLVLPAGWTNRYEITPKCTMLAYGGPPSEADVVHFEQEMWSENPIEPPERVEAGDPAVTHGTETYSHGELLTVATDLVAEYNLTAESRVVLDAPVREPGALLALLGTIAAEGTLELRQQETGGEPTGSALFVTNEESERENTAAVGTLTQRLSDIHRA